MKLNKVKYFTTISRLKNNPFYNPAHQGDLQSAHQLVNQLNLNLSSLKNSFCYVCPVIKQTGNKIPLAFASKICSVTNLKICDTIILTNNCSGNSMMQRIFYEPNFTGQVPTGNYILVDDVITTGNTLKHLKTYIESAGSQVNAIYTLAASRSGGLFEPSKLQYQIYASPFHQFSAYFNLPELTLAQLIYLNRFKSISAYLDKLSLTLTSAGYF